MSRGSSRGGRWRADRCAIARYPHLVWLPYQDQAGGWRPGVRLRGGRCVFGKLNHVLCLFTPRQPHLPPVPQRPGRRWKEPNVVRAVLDPTGACESRGALPLRSHTHTFSSRAAADSLQDQACACSAGIALLAMLTSPCPPDLHLRYMPVAGTPGRPVPAPRGGRWRAWLSPRRTAGLPAKAHVEYRPPSIALM